MIDIDLIKLQKRCKTTCVVIENENVEELDSKIIIDANIGDGELYEILKEKVSNNEELKYFIIKGIDELSNEEQERYTGIVKDRIFGKYNLPENVVIVLTVKDRENLKNISSELYNLSVVAF